MDPEATLREAERLMDARHYHDALDYVNDYLRWRKSGGLEPDDGDLRAKSIMKVCRAAISYK